MLINLTLLQVRNISAANKPNKAANMRCNYNKINLNTHVENSVLLSVRQKCWVHTVPPFH